MFGYAETGVVVASSILSFVGKEDGDKIIGETNNKVNVVSSSSFQVLERIKELKVLFDSGAITEEEFNSLKAKDLANY